MEKLEIIMLFGILAIAFPLWGIAGELKKLNKKK